ncbi:AbrB/MazE/SpoVT family DNA-binding domain-containing protein [Pseudomonas viridiflava]|uniref:AbrB/MazE/SpoVT family DNA-binding domain-containing protein n=1 Tax=Pseudomonas viridiflava TaxID=33069 RepID=UPI000F027F71|nr:AbrB/MazE/SpoVT family DNA-binding domain-containing protein [Pseudomonas viridiflava]QXG24422.1 AbrB/MazE/SpoVT family DNA-binding domain-containing protein [Pseudomonas viridiflava]
MNESEVLKPAEQIIVRCQDPGDGSGDLMIEIPQVVLDTMGIGVGDELTIEAEGDVITLRPIWPIISSSDS